MPLSYRIDPARQLLEVTGEGVVTLAEMRGYFAALETDPAFVPTYDALIDFRSVTDFLTPAEVPLVAAEHPVRRVGAKSRRALVASADLVFGMFRMLEAFADDSSITYEVFRDLATAHRWLAGELER